MLDAVPDEAFELADGEFDELPELLELPVLLLKLDEPLEEL